MIIQLPYDVIGVGIAVVLGVWALLQAETAGGRLLVAAVMIAVFFLPANWRGRAGQMARLIGWIVFGIGCYIFIRLRGVPVG